MSSISSFFSSFFDTVHADTSAESEQTHDEPAEEETEAEEAPAEEEEEEEPEDPNPAIREDCKNSAKCAALAKHFEHCNEKVESGQGFKGEDCVEELLMHCVDACAAPKLFSKLR